MKTRPIIMLGIVAFMATIAWIVLAFTKVTSIPSDQFRDALLQMPGITMSSHMTGAPEPLPWVMRMRFPKQTSLGVIGFPDRTDLYVLNSGSADIDCMAHVRRDKVCYVTLNGNAGVDAMRAKFQDLFPGLPVD